MVKPYLFFLNNIYKVANTKCVKEDKMTQKELLYIEDALGHLKTMEQLLLNAKSNLEDANLKQFVGKQLTKTRQQYNEIFKLLG